MNSNQDCCARRIFSAARKNAARRFITRSVPPVGIAVVWGLVFTISAADETIRLRMENFTVMPSTGPGAWVQVENRGVKEVKAAVRVTWPEGWKGAPEEQEVVVPPGQTARAAFRIEKAIDVAANRYPLTVEARVGDRTVTRRQQVVCATAPYLKPQMDGRLDDWEDAAPITFGEEGRSTTVMTCWNRKEFWVAVRAGHMTTGVLQFALAPEQSDEPGRFEFAVTAPEGDGPAKCYRLMQPGDDPVLAEGVRPLAGLETDELEARATRDGAALCFEIAIPFQALPGLRPAPGRTFQFSLLAHGPEGLRDLGEVMNLWDDRRPPLAWRRWKGASFGPVPPFDSRVEFGFSSSIH